MTHTKDIRVISRCATDATLCPRHRLVNNLARLLASAESEVVNGQIRPMRDFLAEFKRDRGL